MQTVIQMLEAKTERGKPDLATRKDGIHLWKELQSQTFNQDIEAWKREYEVMDRMLQHQERSSAGGNLPPFVRDAK